MPTSNNGFIVLGIDPGIEITGFAIIEENGSTERLIEFGVIRTERGLSLPERLVTLEKDLNHVIDRHPNIRLAGVEELFFSKNAKTAFMVGQARGVILFTLARRGVTIQEVKPVEVKSAIVGSGRADKKEIQKIVQLAFRLAAPPEPDDAADAVAIAMTVGRTAASNRTYSS